MPNWTYNYVSMTDIDQKDLYSIKDGVASFDFNKIIPQPKTKEECPKKYIDDGNCHITHEKGDEWFNWYGWNVDNWGVKWNASMTDISDGMVSFATPWCYPEPIAKALSKMFPEEAIEWTYVDEMYDGDHTFIFKNGECIEETTEYPDWYLEEQGEE